MAWLLLSTGRQQPQAGLGILVASFIPVAEMSSKNREFHDWAACANAPTTRGGAQLKVILPDEVDVEPETALAPATVGPTPPSGSAPTSEALRARGGQSNRPYGQNPANRLEPAAGQPHTAVGRAVDQEC